MYNKGKFYEGIEPFKRFDEYSKQELMVLPDIPNFEAGSDYPEEYETAPIYWNGYEWELIYE